MSSKVQAYLDQAGSKEPSSRPTQDKSATKQQPYQPTSVQRAGLEPESLTSRDVLHLQRTIGNKAVGRLLAKRGQQEPDKFDQVSDESSQKKSEALGQQTPKTPAPKAEAEAKPKTPAPTKPGPKPEAKQEAPAKQAKPTITHETKFAAPDGSAKTRTDVGVGEGVTFTGSAAGEWTATNGKPATQAAGDKFVWTAPDRAADVTIKLKVGTEEASSTLKVLEPDSITGVRNSKIPIPAGTAGAGMKLTFNYHPKKVSFGNVKAREVSGPATNIDGYFKKHYSAAELYHNSGDTFTSIKENNEDSVQDEAKSTDTFKPYENGTFDWVIPNKFKVKTESGDGKKFTDVTQAFSIDATGKEKITKAGAEVERSPGEG